MVGIRHHRLGMMNEPDEMPGAEARQPRHPGGIVLPVGHAHNLQAVLLGV